MGNNIKFKLKNNMRTWLIVLIATVAVASVIAIGSVVYMSN